MPVNMTDARVRALRAEDKKLTVVDTAVRGLGLVVQPKTQTKTFFVQCVVRGRQVRRAIGPFPVVTVALARERAISMLRTMRLDQVDPTEAARNARNAATTMKEAMEQAIEAVDSEQTKRLYRQVRDRWAKAIMGRAVRDVTMDRRGLKELHESVTIDHGPSAADMMVKVLSSAVRRHARLDPAVDVGCFAAVERNGSVARETDLLERLDEFADAVAVQRPVKRDCLILGLLTGCRSGELRSMLLSNLRENRPSVFLETTKNGSSHEVPLSSLALRVAKRAAMIAKGPTIFGATDLRLRGMPGFFPHSLRKGYSAAAMAAGVSVAALKRCLNHSSSDLTIRAYASNLPWDEVVRAAEDTSRWIAARMTPRSRSILGFD